MGVDRGRGIRVDVPLGRPSLRRVLRNTLHRRPSLEDPCLGFDRWGFLMIINPATRFCEMFDREGQVRPHYRPLAERLATLGTADMEERARLTEATFRNLGITFAVYGAGEGVERTWPIDLLPRIISGTEWDVVEHGLIQRTRALGAFLDDIYAGESAVIEDKIIPRWLVQTSDGYKREAVGIGTNRTPRCVVVGIDLVRDSEGTYRVLEDNLRVPSGISYVIENRAAMRRAFPLLFERYSVRPVDDYGSTLLAALRFQAPVGVDTPTIVVLTPGVFNSAHFEHSFLARRRSRTRRRRRPGRRRPYGVHEDDRRFAACPRHIQPYR